MLYRGVNKTLDRENSGRLSPTGTLTEVTPLFDGKWELDGRFNLGASESNTARAHQIETGLYGGCGVSTTRSEEKAISFATQKYSVSGYIYLIDEEMLENSNVTPYEFQDPKYPNEKEVTLIERNGDALPECIILEKYEVDSKGKRIYRFNK